MSSKLIILKHSIFFNFDENLIISLKIRGKYGLKIVPENGNSANNGICKGTTMFNVGKFIKTTNYILTQGKLLWVLLINGDQSIGKPK